MPVGCTGIQRTGEDMAKQASGRGTKAERSKRREKPQQIADELRQLIVSGELDEGDSLGKETELIERFGVSRPSLREALRILEAEGLISVIRGVLGGVVVHRPAQPQTARTAARSEDHTSELQTLMLPSYAVLRL